MSAPNKSTVLSHAITEGRARDAGPARQQYAPAPARPAEPAPSEHFLGRQHLGQPWCANWRRFAKDMTRIGHRVHEATARDGWGGPAVTIPRAEFQTVMRATNVPLDWHEVGDFIMAYPAPAWV